jgi:RHS repeat-associated protein
MPRGGHSCFGPQAGEGTGGEGGLATPTADSCQAYNYYSDVPNPTTCVNGTPPSQGTHNNGNVIGYYHVDNANPLNHQLAFTYDAVNRLTSAVATGQVTYTQNYSYTNGGADGRFGNMSCSPLGPGCVNFAYNPANNHITTSGYSYDGAGNVIGDGMNSYYWDAESHLAAVYASANGSLVSMNTYNALGQRVEDITQAGTTEEAYGAGGNLLLRYTGDSNSRSFVPFNGRLLAEYYCGGMIFDHPDGIGSATTATDCTGNVVNEKLFYPFGEAWTGYALPNLGMHQTFAQLPDYDPETDQYNTANRHCSPTGRWMSPDPGGIKTAHLEDPQTWNMYAYVRNNPTTLTDPNGDDVDLVNDTDEGRRKALADATANLNAKEAANIGIRGTKDGGYEAYVIDKGAIGKGASTQYKQLVNLINDHSIVAEVGLIGGGLSATFQHGSMAAFGSISSYSGQDSVFAPNPGSKYVDALVTQGNLPGGTQVCCNSDGHAYQGVQPEFMTMWHELMGETMKYRAGYEMLLATKPFDSDVVIATENYSRAAHGMPQRTGADHGRGIIVNGKVP